MSVDIEKASVVPKKYTDNAEKHDVKYYEGDRGMDCVVWDIGFKCSSRRRWISDRAA